MSLRKRPLYMIGIASELIGVHPQTLRMYEQKGLLRPRKSIKNTRLYSQEDVELGRHIQRLTQELGMNLAGVKTVLDLEGRVARLASGEPPPAGRAQEAGDRAPPGRRRDTPELQAGDRPDAPRRARARSQNRKGR